MLGNTQRETLREIKVVTKEISKIFEHYSKPAPYIFTLKLSSISQLNLPSPTLHFCAPNYPITIEKEDIEVEMGILKSAP